MSTLLQAVVRAADARTPDADLLARFAQNRDEPAFEELVQRHGPLVWAVCRQLLPHHADAEDAFQAVFLALVRGCGSIRSGQALPAWLHGVAVRVATKVKRAAARRKQREERAAVPEANRPVTDAAWTNLMAAVHEEVRRLPEAERTAFVLCDLEGVRQSDAAARLGWTPGTLTGRLCKARQRLIELLTRRGIAPSVLALGGLATSAGTVPAALSAKVISFPAATAAGVSATVAELARGLAQGVTMRTKLTAAAVLLVGALGLGGGAVLLSNADAQTKDVQNEVKGLLGGLQGKGAQPKQPGGGRPKQPEAGSDPFGGQPPRRDSGLSPPGENSGPPRTDSSLPGAGSNFSGQPGMGMPGMMGRAGSPAVEHKFVDLNGDDREAFVKAITEAGNDGWEFCGSEHLTNWKAGGGPPGGGGGQLPHIVLVFKRHKGGAVGGGMMGSGMGGPAGTGLSTGGNRGGSGFGGGGGSGGGGSRSGSNNDFRVFKLTDANADDVVAALQKAFPRIKAVAERSSNSVVIVSAGTASMKEINELIEKLDAKTDPKPKAGGAGPGPGAGRPPTGTGAGPRPAGGAPGSMGPPGFGSAGGPPPGMSGPGGAGATGPTSLNVMTLKHGIAADTATLLQRLFPGGEFVADLRTNSVIIRGDEKTLEEVRLLVTKLETIETPAKR
jgi:RNA polymerase sigma factor (sigma-70 family)